MSIVRIAGCDPSFRNFGIVKFDLDLDTMNLDLKDMTLIETEKSSGKDVRKNSDDLRCAAELYEGFTNYVRDCSVVFSEIPSGAQSARAAFSFGIALGVLAASPIPVIQVQPSETKLATVGTKTASKEEMIEWAMETYSAAPWRMRMFKGKSRPTASNEHLADAAAVVHAGVKTNQFKQLMALWRASKTAA